MTQNQVRQLAFWVTQSGLRRMQPIKNTMAKSNILVFNRDKSKLQSSGLKKKIHDPSILPFIYTVVKCVYYTLFKGQKDTQDALSL